MIVNQANLHGLTVGYSTAFNKSFDTTQSNYQKVATVVPSTTGEQDYKWLGQMPGMREWIGEREVQALAAYDYLIKNKKFEMTIGVPRDDIEDDKYGVYTPLFSNMGEAAALQPDELVFGAMMSGFNEKCYDGLSFFNTAHKVGDATYSNRSNKKLSRESYMEGRSSIMSIKGDKGKSLKLVPDLLVVPPALEETATTTKETYTSERWGKEGGTTIHQISFTVDISKIKDLPLLYKLIDELKDAQNRTDSPTPATT